MLTDEKLLEAERQKAKEFRDRFEKRFGENGHISSSNNNIKQTDISKEVRNDATKDVSTKPPNGNAGVAESPTPTSTEKILSSASPPPDKTFRCGQQKKAADSVAFENFVTPATIVTPNCTDLLDCLDSNFSTEDDGWSTFESSASTSTANDVFGDFETAEFSRPRANTVPANATPCKLGGAFARHN